MDNEPQQRTSDADVFDLVLTSLFEVEDGTVETSDAPAADNDNGGSNSNKRPKRHTAEQIKHLEAVFERCTHPEEKLRVELAKILGMEEKQIKFWFQNRRTQRKVKNERHEGMVLQAENEMLRAENRTMREELLKKACFTCGSPVVPTEETPEQRRLRSENARLTDELLRATAVLTQVSQNADPPATLHLSGDVAMLQYSSSIIVDIQTETDMVVDTPTPLPSVNSSSP